QWQQVELLLGMDFSQLLDYLVANILMPTVGLLMAVMVGWLLPESMVREGFKRESKFRFNGWLLLLKYVAPILIYIIFFLPVIQRMLS
ncbi:MAG: hypothetical protein OIF35_03480, partial [Cellvibrionaceae bacterium]|nr:hypothetical protein [Cellvibrionaceae bacterium]